MRVFANWSFHRKISERLRALVLLSFNFQDKALRLANQFQESSDDKEGKKTQASCKDLTFQACQQVSDFCAASKVDRPVNYVTGSNRKHTYNTQKANNQ